jgi:cyclic nucleotide gated channel
MCKKKDDCQSENFYCTGFYRNKDFDGYINDACPFTDPDNITDPNAFNFGIFNDLLSSGVAESRNFSEKFFYCFWWGLRSLRLAIYKLHSYSVACCQTILNWHLHI